MRVTAVQKPRHGKWKDAKKMAIRKGQAMASTNVEPQTALKFETEVLRDGKLELQVPLAEGRHVTVFVVPEQPDSFSERHLEFQFPVSEDFGFKSESSLRLDIRGCHHLSFRFDSRHP